MNIRLGIIGVEDNLELIQSIANEYPEFTTFPFLHALGEEVIDILKAHQHDIDMWVFSGYYVYQIAERWGKVTQPMFYVPYTESSLYKTLYQAQYHDHINSDEISFDAFEPYQFSQIFSELDVNVNPAHLKPYAGSIDEIVEHHYRLWTEGKTKAAVTCIWMVRNELKRLGVPVFRVRPSESAISSVLNMALRTHEMLRFKNAQIAVQMLEIDTFMSLSKDMYSSDELNHFEMKHTQELLVYAKKIQGSLKTVGPGRYVIFTTRGLLSDITQDFTAVPNMEEIQQIDKDVVTCGIGLGQSAYEAEIHAGKALLHAKEKGKGAWMVHFEDKTINGPLGKPETITYSYDTKKFQTISQQTSLSVATIGKVDSILKKIGKNEITAHELSQQMQIMPRSARRILVELEKHQFAQGTGEESPNPRGRPRKIYRIQL
ncbi:transcriptional regulator [Tuberibacillus sp. Marseille-P3662]|uniref:transcriptional regulator n=1 Tax=Tuberibacillus sp. Marseille-P3662 TaxID=1965358 RepID=UPI000A1C8271|nr:transcriptional regulator [Tuberibacillus sp. Marseille-P3662]